MTEAMEKLYDLVAGTIQMDEEQKKRLEALSVAKKGVLEALETPGAKPSMELWNVLASLDGQAENCGKRPCFRRGWPWAWSWAACGPGGWIDLCPLGAGR